MKSYSKNNIYLTFIYAVIVVAVYQITTAFSMEFTSWLMQLFHFSINTYLVFEALITLLSIAYLLFLYKKYIPKSDLSELHFVQDSKSLKLCFTAVFSFSVLILFYLFIAKGTLYKEPLSKQDLTYAWIYTCLSSGFISVFRDIVFFQGILLKHFRKRYSLWMALLLTVIFQLAAYYSELSDYTPSESFLIVLSMILINVSLSLIVCCTHSIWPAICFAGSYNILSGNGYILHIGSERSPYAIWNYVPFNKSWYIAGISGADRIETGLPAMICFTIIIIIAIHEIKVSGGN